MSLRCSICRAEFPSAKAFRRQPVGKGKYRRLCPGCSNRYAESASNFGLFCSAIMAIVGVALIWAWPQAPYGWGCLFVGILYLTFVLTVLPHELGHALAALAVGMRVFTVTVGWSGRILLVAQVFGYDFVFRSIPLGGSAHIGPKSVRFARLRYFIAVLGGPLANLLLIVLALWLIDDSSREDITYWALAAFIYGNIIKLALGLFPRKVRHERRRIPNDGLILLQIFRMSRTSIDAWHSTTFYYEALEALERGNVSDARRWLANGVEAYPDNSWSESMQASILTHEHKYREARDIYLAILSRPESKPEFQSQLWNGIAWLDLRIDDPTLLEEADQFSRRAIEDDPWSSLVRGTRGSVLIELGQIDEGYPLVEQAFQENDRDAKALNACYLAIAESRQGGIRNARWFINEAKKRDPNCPLLERAMREVERVPC